MHPIKQLRLEHKLTQAKLSQITGIPVRTLQNWEGGQRPAPEYMFGLIKAKLESAKREGE